MRVVNELAQKSESMVFLQRLVGYRAPHAGPLA